tara:strand:- start:68 stop:370 length:303 start_codon:yes stop_codon:yes gene_type:complete
MLTMAVLTMAMLTVAGAMRGRPIPLVKRSQLLYLPYILDLLYLLGEFLKVKWKQFAIDFDDIPVPEEKAAEPFDEKMIAALSDLKVPSCLAGYVSECVGK